MKSTIIISGANGQLGKALQLNKSFNETYDCFFYSKDQLDITNFESLEKSFQKIKPNYFINAAAYTAVDKAEEEIEKCFLINDFALHSISHLCKVYQTKLVHISSDYVYHLDLELPITEENATLPRGIYAQSKLAGEQKVIASDCSYIILRTSWVYAAHGNNFIKTVLRIAKEKDQMNVVKDQIGTPTSAVDIVDTIYYIISAYKPKAWDEIYNYSNEGKTNWYEIADYIVKSQNLAMKINPIPSSDYPTPAERPKWSLMNTEKIKRTFGLKIPNWKISLEKCLQELMVS